MKEVTCPQCKKAHYDTFAACPFCPSAKRDPEGNIIPPQYDNDEARAAYARIGTVRTWDGKQQSADSPPFTDPKEDQS